MKALILTADGAQDVEVIYPLYRLQEAGFSVDVATPGAKDIVGIKGVPIKATCDIDWLSAVQYDLLVIPGGVKAMEKLRLICDAVKLVQEFHSSGKVIASICSGAQMLISAGIVRGITVSCYPAMAIDIENAGGHFLDEVVTCDRIVSGPHYDKLGEWMAAVLSEFESNRGCSK